ncbi:membrane spanning 4-domains A1 [Rhinolophus ferrumequinum]|uniref:Membrane spanning 4-domains A1 n=1 Tax=Rhinolophus ferrumequinum TaxID=59479 RepID=A0A671DVL7_RHIFE|nr:membrane spanning 4-domains A1 [Rhinolophus ferrumequinum]
MTTPRNSMSGGFPADPPMKRPVAMQPAQKLIPRTMPSMKLVTAGTIENEWKKLCSRSKADVVLLSAEEKKEQAIEVEEEVVELTEISSQPKNEEDFKIITVQEDEEETEINFPEPPPNQESSPIENDSAP